MRRKADNWILRNWLRFRSFCERENEGMGTVEVILIIVVLIGLVIIFKSQITELVESIFSKITSQTKQI